MKEGGKGSVKEKQVNRKRHWEINKDRRNTLGKTEKKQCKKHKME